RGFEATPAVRAAAEAAGTLNALEQVIQGAERQMESELQRSQKFDVVARGDLSTILKEQDLADSGLVDQLDPNTARSLQLAGARYVAILTVDGFQDVTDRTTLQKQLGPTRAERRSIQLSGVVQVYDTTSARMLSSAPLTIDRNQLEEIIPGVERTGNKTQAVLASVASALGAESAASITSAIFPAKVLAYTFGQITFNRTGSSGVSDGQIWEVMHAGEELIDPDTGASLGSEEVTVGWARVTDAGDRFSKAQAIVDNGIAKGAIMRYRPEGLPAGIDPSATASGSDGTPTGNAAPVPAVSAPSSATSSKVSGATVRPGSNGTSPSEARTGRTFAVVTRLLADDLPENSTGILEEDIAACLSGQGVTTVSRADIVNGVARFAGESANTGTPDSLSRAVEEALSDLSSAIRLAELLGADGIVVASITNYTIENRSFDDPNLGVRSNIRTYRMGVSLRVVDGLSGRSLYGGTADATKAIRRTSELEQELDPIDDLLQEASRNICSKVASAASSIAPPAAPEASESNVSIGLVASGLEVPDIIADADDRLTVGSARLPLSLVGARVYVDGVLAGSAPGSFAMRPGVHRLTIEHPLFSPLEQVVNIRGGEGVQSLTFSMKLSAEGRRDWEQNIAVLEALKDGEVLRESQLISVRAFAEFLRNSSINLDTSEVRNLNLGGPSFWAQLLGD
ncbi:MAG: CsgG/HfaB family protein, partial [Planctomycetota bacterium]|nr:CsgG/HfaB family protein [Planctomycetota bacterium]